MAKELRTYTILKGIANNLSQPFISFTAVSSGILGEYLGLISSASTFFTALAQFISALLRTRAKSLLLWGNFVSGVSWIVLALIPFQGPLYTLTYFTAELGLGISLMGWNLIMERLSTTARGVTLSQYTVYSTLGQLVSTLLAGIFVGSSTSLIRIPFALTGAITLSCAFLGQRTDVDVEDPARRPRVSRKLLRFFLISFLFTVVWSFAWPLFPMAQVYIFHMTYFNVAVISVIGGISTLFLRNRVGRLVDRNRRFSMFLGRILLATFPLAYALAPNIFVIYAVEPVAGLTSLLGSTAYVSYLYDSSTKEDVKMSLGVYSLVQGLGAVVGSLISSAIFMGVEPILGLERGVEYLLLTSAVLRIMTSFGYLKLKV